MTIDADTVEVESADGVGDGPIEGLLRRVYVDGGFTDAGVAAALFTAHAVRARGEILVVRGAPDGLRGMVIVVGPNSPARKLAGPNEAEMHLLAVSPDCRGQGVGRALVAAAVARARALGHHRMVLWTQVTMHAAQRLYLSVAFQRRPERDFQAGGRQFLVLDLPLDPPSADGSDPRGS